MHFYWWKYPKLTFAVYFILVRSVQLMFWALQGWRQDQGDYLLPYVDKYVQVHACDCEMLILSSIFSQDLHEAHVLHWEPTIRTVCNTVRRCMIRIFRCASISWFQAVSGWVSYRFTASASMGLSDLFSTNVLLGSVFSTWTGWQNLAAFRREQKWPSKFSPSSYLQFLRQKHRFCA